MPLLDLHLQTLFNIVEDPLNIYILNFDVCVVWWCSDGPINSLEYKSFEIYAATVTDIYDHWISPLKKR